MIEYSRGYYLKSINILLYMLDEKDVTEDDWNFYAEVKGLFSSRSIKEINNVDTWDELLEKLKGQELIGSTNKIYKEIKKWEKKLDKAVHKGIDNKKTVEISEKVNDLINRFYETTWLKNYKKGSIVGEFYEKSYEALLEYTKIYGYFPTEVDWNVFAKSNCYMNNISLEYVSSLDWKTLEIRIKSEK